MFGKKKEQSAKIKEAVQKNLNFELTIAEQHRKSLRLSNWMALAFFILSILLVIGLIMMLPLKQTQPYLVVVDPATGGTSTTKIEGNINSSSSSSLISKSNVARFVNAIESYDSYSTPNRDYKLVNAMASPEVFEPYRSLLKRQDASSPFVEYGDKRSIKTVITSITLSPPAGAPANTPPNQADVRFQRFIVDKKANTETPKDVMNATLKFTYNASTKADPNNIDLNPLGFFVTFYSHEKDPFSVLPIQSASKAGTTAGTDVSVGTAPPPIASPITAPAATSTTGN